jgi:hypothetical protein
MSIGDNKLAVKLIKCVIKVWFTTPHYVAIIIINLHTIWMLYIIQKVKKPNSLNMKTKALIYVSRLNKISIIVNHNVQKHLIMMLVHVYYKLTDK